MTSRSCVGVGALAGLMLALGGCGSSGSGSGDAGAGDAHQAGDTLDGASAADGSNAGDRPTDARDPTDAADAALDGTGDSPSLADGDAARAPIDALDGGPPTPIAVQVPFASAATVTGWRASCVTSADDTSSTATCWVIAWRGWTYWALGNPDNRQAFLIIGVDAAGNLKSRGLERMGARYLWSATVDDGAMTVTFLGQGGASVTLSWNDLDELPPAQPEASEAPIEDGPHVAGGWYPSCVSPVDGITATNTCAVVKWGQWTYWALSNVDNRQSVYVIGVDASGAVNAAGGAEVSGGRYVWGATVDATARTATFECQVGDVTIGFDALRIDQP